MNNFSDDYDSYQIKLLYQSISNECEEKYKDCKLIQLENLFRNFFQLQIKTKYHTTCFISYEFDIE